MFFYGSIDALRITGMETASKYSWFTGCAIAFLVYYRLATKGRHAVHNVPPEPEMAPAA